MTIVLHTINAILIVMALVSAYQAGYTKANTDKTDENDISEGKKQTTIVMAVATFLVAMAYTMGVLLG